MVGYVTQGRQILNAQNYSRLKQYPNKLTDLLSDNRFPTIQRHLRQVYIDPISGTDKWGLVITASGGISGVFSPSHGSPIKRAEFAEKDEQFLGKNRYSDWRFIYEKGQVKNMPAIFFIPVDERKR